VLSGQGGISGFVPCSEFYICGRVGAGSRDTEFLHAVRPFRGRHAVLSGQGGSLGLVPCSEFYARGPVRAGSRSM